MNFRKLLTFTIVVLSFWGLISMDFFSFFIKNDKNQIIQVKGSDTILNVSQSVTEEFLKEHPQARISVTGGGTGTGIAAKINKTANIAMASRAMKKEEYEKAQNNGVDIKEVTIAYDAITIVINEKNTVKNLSKDDLRSIYLGTIKNWKEVGGPDQKIIVISRDSSSGTHLYFKEHVLRKGKAKGPEEFGKEVLFLPSNESIKQQVTGGLGTIAYLGLGYVDKSVKPITIDGIGANTANVKNKSYPIARGVYWYIDKNISGTAKELVDFMVSDRGQKIVEEEGFVSIN